jgi:hypothetical protein
MALSITQFLANVCVVNYFDFTPLSACIYVKKKEAKVKFVLPNRRYLNKQFELNKKNG